MPNHDSGCPFCIPESDRVAFVEPLLKALWDGFPVSPGHLLIVPHRHVASWADLHSEERLAIVKAVENAQSLIRDRHGADGFNVGFNDGAAAGQTIPHFHLHVIPRRNGDVPDPRGGVRHVIPEKANYLLASDDCPTEAPHSLTTPHDRALIAGGEDALIQHLLPHIDQSIAVDAAISFALESGVRLLRPHLQELLDRGGRLRFLTGDYLDVTDPDALRRLMDLDGDANLFVFEAGTTGFHPKAWIFHFHDQSGVALVGSSNLSETALRTGVEWNFRTFTPNQNGAWRDVLNGFEELIDRYEVKRLTHDWIDRYERRRVAPSAAVSSVAEVAPEPPAALPNPHPIQQEALVALEETRRQGFSAGLVVLATGLGKTWLSAFDANRPEFRRVLFVAHREEILSQALETYRVCRSKARLGRYNGTQKDLDSDILFASIQTLGRIAHLRHFAPDHFDYIVVDEFHHAAAATYKKLIDHFTPRFLLGLTATPDRMDGGDLLGLCQENLVFRCDVFAGIRSGLLSPFSYYGVPDDVDYSQIPWRGSGFDEAALTAAVATQARAQNAFEQHRRLAGTRTLAFCVSQRHADFMARFFAVQGLRAAAVHSGPSSAPRASSLEALEAGELDVVFSVDMFNEGVDVPHIDTVLMLRPTESSIVWMQQFGRGLRRAEGKDRLNVIDYIGNHRTFVTKVRTLLQCAEGDRVLLLKLEQAANGSLDLPPGCEITYELEALDLLKAMLRSPSKGDALEAYYQDFRLRFGTRPTALEVFHAGFNPRQSGHGGWFQFVRDQRDATLAESAALTSEGDFLDTLIKAPMTRSYKMLLLRALRLENALPGVIDIDRLQKRFSRLAATNPSYRRDISIALDNDQAVRGLLEANPIRAWMNTAGKYFRYENGVFTVDVTPPPSARVAFLDMVDEVIDWRLAEYLSRADEDGEADLGIDEIVLQPPGPALWREYSREQIAPLFALKFNTGAWNQGFVAQGKHVFVLVTLDKSSLGSDHKYEDGFLSPERFRWQSQNQTSQASKHGQIISGTLPGYQIHLFVRATKTRGQKATPFTYCGVVAFESWEGERPITVVWKLGSPVPSHMRRVFGVPEVPDA